MTDKTPQAAPPLRRAIRSFVRREGRITRAQQRALDQLWPRYGVELNDAPLDLDALFGRAAPCIFEIGFGNGEATANMAAAAPQNNYLAIDVHRPGVGNLLMLLERNGLNNVRIIQADAKEVLQRHIPDASLDAVYIFFPDPWPKKRHHKRRLLQPDFVQLVCRKLKPGGSLHMATDWQDYAESSLQVLDQSTCLINIAGKGHYSERPAYRPETKFERRGLQLGHEVWDLIFERCAQ